MLLQASTKRGRKNPKARRRQKRKLWEAFARSDDLGMPRQKKINAGLGDNREASHGLLSEVVKDAD